MQVLAGLDGIALRDGSSLTPDSQVVSANMMVSSGGPPLGCWKGVHAGRPGTLLWARS